MLCAGFDDDKDITQLRLTSDTLRGFSEPGQRPPETKTHTSFPAVVFSAWLPVKLQ